MNQPIQELLRNRKCISIELCPNRDLCGNLLSQVYKNFYSLTWHERLQSHDGDVTQAAALRLANELCCQGYNVLLNLAGRNLNTVQALDVLNAAKNVGVRNIFALQGDPSQIEEKDNIKWDFPYAVDLVRFIRKHFQDYFCIGVAGYPEGHPQAKNFETDMAYLKQKAALADFIITQACFDYEAFQNFAVVCRKNSITIPIIAGIFVISSYKSLLTMSKFCAISVPKDIMEFVAKHEDDLDTVKKFGQTFASDLMKKLLKEDCGYGGVHIFSMNNLQLVKELLEKINETLEMGLG